MTRMDRRPRTAAYRKFAIDRDTMPMPISFSRVMSTYRWQRIVRCGSGTTSHMPAAR